MIHAGFLDIVPMAAHHGVAIERQASQRVQFGLDAKLTLETAGQLADGLEAWAALDRAAGDRVVALFGLAEAFAGTQAIAWATLSRAVGAAHHLRISRFVRGRLDAQRLARIEAIVECRDMEPIVARFSGLDAGQLVEIARAAPTPGMRWAEALGFRPSCVLRKFGAGAASHMLYERIS